MEDRLSVGQALTITPACWAGFERLSGIGDTFTRLAERSRVVALAHSKEVKRLSRVFAAVSRSVEAPGKVAAAVAFAHSEEVKRISSLAAAVSRSVEAPGKVAAAAAFTHAEEFKRLSSIGAAVSRSVKTPGKVAAAAALARPEEPFSRIVGKLPENEFGEVVTLDLNDNADERVEIVVRAGFNLSVPSVPVPQAIERADSSAAFDPQCWQIMNELEQRLRQEVERRLKNLCGPNWTKHRVPEDMRERWLGRQQEDRDSGRPVYAAIQYADFMDLAAVITKKDNWRDAFQPIFDDQNDITVVLRRLHPVRKALAHSRPLGRADELTLFSEATRIFRAFGMSVLH